ncbi:MAG: sigma-54 dependent transcriptional regulator [Acidobacteriia bacterium]|nr:sigma-54 dependent transcriptional regulator [Terriglobia bacterium]
MAYSILVVDDEALTLRTISRALRDEGFEVFLATTGEEALEIFAREHPAVVMLDVVLPGIDGIEVLRQIKRQSPGTIVVMMSAYHMIDRAVEAMKLGAHDYLSKPFHLADMVNTIRRALEMLALRVRVSESVETAKGQYDFGMVKTINPEMQHLLEICEKAAQSEHTTILILGESGTGKGVLAKALHYNSPRAQMPLLELNCAAMPDALLESELFGYEPGAFTDARRRKEGLLERAQGGTVFLDEIGNMSASVQAKILRVLEEGTFMRLGGTRVIKVDVRIIAATNSNLKEAVARGQFREDLFYRLNVLPITLPPLRERKEDILPLAVALLERFNKEMKKSFTGFTPAAAELLKRHLWPGNIRELKNVIERTMILAPEGDIDAEYLPEEIRDYSEPVETHEPSHMDLSPTGQQWVTLRELEERYIHEVLTLTGNNKAQAARILGIHPTSILRRLKKEQEEDKVETAAE